MTSSNIQVCKAVGLCQELRTTVYDSGLFMILSIELNGARLYGSTFKAYARSAHLS